MFLNRMNMKNNSQKSKKHVSSFESKKQHIEDFYGNPQDDDNHVSNNGAFQTTTKNYTFEGTVTQPIATKK